MDMHDLKDRIEVIIKKDENQEIEDEISLRDIILALIRGKKTIAVTVIITLLVALFFTSFTNPDRTVRYKAETLISLNFDGIEKGLDPNGNRFDVGKVKSPEVLDKVVIALNLSKKEINAEDLRNNIEITPIVPGSIVKKIQDLIEMVPKTAQDSSYIAQLQDYQYFPTQFKIIFNAQKSMDLDAEESEQILQGIIDAYSNYFYDTYSDRQVLADAIQRIDYNDYDYPEVPLIMRNQINLMQSYLAAKTAKGGDFRSTVTGLSFSDIYASLALLEDIDINNLNSIISSYRITKDKDQLLRSFEYRIKSNQKNMAMKLDESRQATDVRNSYQKDKTFVMMGTATGLSDGTMELEKTSPLYDALAQRSLDSGVSATDTQHNIEFIIKEMDLYKTDVDIAPEIKVQKTEQVIQMIASTDKKLRNWIELTNKTVDDYLKSIYFHRAVMQITPVEVSHPVIIKLLLNMSIALILGLMAGVLIALFKDYWKRSNEENTEDMASGDQVEC